MQPTSSGKWKGGSTRSTCGSARRRKERRCGFVGCRNPIGWWRKSKMRAGGRFRNAAYRARSAPGTGDYLQEPAGGLPEITGSEPAENRVSGFRRARIEDAAGGDQGLLRLVARGFARAADGQAARHPGGIQRELRTIGAPGLHVPELFGTGERQACLATARERLRDCLDELSKRWFEAFQRKGVRLEAKIDPSIPTFRFDYQKVQQVAANLLDNS